jgi:hypothetical protein
MTMPQGCRPGAVENPAAFAEGRWKEGMGEGFKGALFLPLPIGERAGVRGRDVVSVPPHPSLSPKGRGQGMVLSPEGRGN